MEFSRDILLGSDTIGTAKVSREGLYYKFSCKCFLTGEVVFKIVAECGDKTASLGICVPKGKRFGLEKRIPVKMLGEGQLVLRAVPNRPDLAGEFVPLRPEEPFAYIERLQKCHIEKRGSILGVVLEDI